VTDSTSGPESTSPADPAGGARTPLPGLGEKPTIAEVAAWLRRAAEERRQEAGGASAAATTTASAAPALGEEARADTDPRPGPSTDAGEVPTRGDGPEPEATPRSDAIDDTQAPTPEVEPPDQVEARAAAEPTGPEPELVGVADPVDRVEDTLAADLEAVDLDMPVIVPDEVEAADAAPAAAGEAVEIAATPVRDEAVEVVDVADRAEVEEEAAADEPVVDDTNAAATSGAAEPPFSLWAPAVETAPSADVEPVATTEPHSETAGDIAEPANDGLPWAPLVDEPPAPVAPVSAWAPHAEPDSVAPMADLDAIADELVTRPTPVVVVETTGDATDDDRPLAVPKVGLFTLPEEVPAEPVVLGVPAITLPEADETEETDDVGPDSATEPDAAAAFDVEAEEALDRGAAGDEDDGDEVEPAPAAKKQKQPRRKKRQKVRYPRGQLKERIGFFRRLRALIGITIVAALLGIGLAALIGGALIFIFLAGRSAING
jgi:hypothetical protein